MSSRLAKVRAVFTAVGVVLGVALLLAVVILVLGGIVSYVGGTVFGGGGGDSTVQGPDVELETTVADDGVTVRHAGGDNVSAGEIRFEVNGEDRGTWAQHASDDIGMVSEGASVQLPGVASGDDFVVSWERDTMTRELHSETL